MKTAVLGTVCSLVFCGYSGAQPAEVALPARLLTPSDLRGGDYVRDGFGARTDVLVYSIGSPSENGGSLGGPLTAVAGYDDVRFGGPASSGDVVINGLSLGAWYPTDAPGHLYARVTFYQDHSNTVPANQTPHSGESVVWQLDLGEGWGGPGQRAGGAFFDNPATFVNPIVLTEAFIGTDRIVGCKLELFVDAAFTTRASGHDFMRRVNYGQHVVGGSDPFTWFAPANPGDGVIVNRNRSGRADGPRGVFLKLQGTGYTLVAPVADYDLGCVADGRSSFPIDTAVSQNDSRDVAWASVCLAGDATDNAGATGVGQFIDLWLTGAGNISMAIFDSEIGNLLAVDHSDGPDGNGQFSFGIGRRSAVGNGKQRDGRDAVGISGLTAGNYLVAFAPQGSTFADGWIVNPASGGSRIGMLELETNVNGTRLDASVPPLIDADLDSNGVILAPGVALPFVYRSPFAISWYRFTTCQDSSDSLPISVDLASSDLPPSGSAHAVFDDSGNLIASRSAEVGNAAPIVFDSGSVLPAGTYYIMQSYQGTAFSPVAGTAGRWHARSTVGNSGFAFEGVLLVGYNACPAACSWEASGCPADQDGDGDIDSDDVSGFFANFQSVNECADQDGDGGLNPDDISTFFTRFEVGGC